MNRIELLRSALRALRAHKLRSFLTLLGVIIGVTTIVSVVGIIAGLDAYVKEKIIVFAPDVYAVSKMTPSTSMEEFIRQLRRPPITWQEYERVAGAGLPNTATVGMAIGKPMTVNTGARHLADIRVVGSTASFARMFNLEFEGGRFFSEAEDLASANVAVIGANTREELFPRLDPLGRIVLLGGLPFRIVGLMPKQGKGMGMTQDDRIYIPSSVFRKNFMVDGDSISLYCQAEGGVAGLEASTDEVQALLRASRHTAYRAENPFGVITQDSMKEMWKQISSASFILMALVSSVSLGVGGIVIMNIMLVSVVERTQEIGVRRAIGAHKHHIRKQFLLEAAILSLVGGLLGLLVGSCIIWLVRYVADFPAQITLGIVFSSVIVSTLVGLLAGLLPAIRASNLPVIDALRAE